jgi:hypothetical protein
VAGVSLQLRSHPDSRGADTDQYIDAADGRNFDWSFRNVDYCNAWIFTATSLNSSSHGA